MKRKFLIALSMVSAGALSVAACSDPEPDPAESILDDGSMETNATDMAMPMAYSLDATQQAARNELDMTAYETETKAYMDEDQAEMASSGNDMGSGNVDTSGATSASSNGTMSMNKSNFSDLDRNDDGKLSVAEYAVWAVGADPTAKNGAADQNAPYVSTEALNRAADGFYFYDKSGDTYLQEDEFQMAKDGSRGSAAAPNG